MVKNAESTGTGIFTNKNDDRITNFGNFLRKYSLDELPQIFNVFKGEMSIVGPRPPVLFHPYKIDQYPEEYIKRFNFKPGITGLAQISGRTNITWEERFVFDLIYINNYSILLDVKILFTTVKNIFKKIEVYPSEEYIKNNHKN
jgi:lipopolysaccharide/colanic/teichoic acid biosynthesis glycosyltransferase